MILAYFNLDFIGRKFGKSPLFVEYLFLLPLMVYGSMTFNLLSIFLAHYRKSDWVMMIRDIGFRFFNFVLLGLVFLKFISFNTFVKLYSVSFALAAIAVLILLRKNKLITFTLSITKLSRRLSPKNIKIRIFYVVSRMFVWLPHPSWIRLELPVYWGLNKRQFSLSQATLWCLFHYLKRRY